MSTREGGMGLGEDTWRAVEVYAKFRRMAESPSAAENERKIAARKVAEMEGQFPNIRDTYTLYNAFVAGGGEARSAAAPRTEEARVDILGQITKIAQLWNDAGLPFIERLEKTLSTFRGFDGGFRDAGRSSDDDEDYAEDAEEDEEEEDILPGVNLGEVEWAAEGWEEALEHLEWAGKRVQFQVQDTGDEIVGDILKIPAWHIPAGMLVEASVDPAGAQMVVQWLLEQIDSSMQG